MFLRAALCIVICLTFMYVSGQKASRLTIASDSISTTSFNSADTNIHSAILNDSLIFLFHSVCKGLHINWYPSLVEKPTAPGRIQVGANAPNDKQRTPFLRVHGNIQYNYLYRSFVDTPFSQNDFQQHTIQTFLTFTVKDKYPVNVNFSQRISNSPYFKDFLDINARFDKQGYLKNARQLLLNKLPGIQRPDLAAAEKKLKDLIDKYNALKLMLGGQDVRQRIVEEREKALWKKQGAQIAPLQLPNTAIDLSTIKEKVFSSRSLSKTGDSLTRQYDSTYLQLIGQKKQQLDSLQQELSKWQKRADSLRNNVNKTTQALQQKIYKATSLQELASIESAAGLAPEKKTGTDKFLSNLKSVGIGRSVVNYSELTAWNVSLTGFNMEYTPGFYTAVAAGKIDYGFRDFMGKNTRQKGQTFLMGRIGLGDAEKKALIFSAFTGRKYSYGSIVNDSVSSYVNLTGYSVEAIYKKNENTRFSAEVAKTTKPLSGQLPDHEKMKSLWKFSDNANLGISLKGQTMIAKTGTRIEGLYRKTGESFQSFSLFTYNTDQTSWSLKAEQPFYKNRISVMGMLRRNDFTNPFTEKTFKTSTVFKSVQLTVRMPKWPVASIGYYPGTQLYIVDKETIRENAYYILNGSLMYHYKVGNSQMLSAVMFNQYAGKGTDSGFIAYNGTNYMASQSMTLGKWQLQGIYTYTDQELMQFYSLEAGVDCAISNWLRAGMGIKYNQVRYAQAYTGGRATLEIDVKKLGGLRFQYDKSYLPTIWQTLYPVETGNVTWFKYF